MSKRLVGVASLILLLGACDGGTIGGLGGNGSNEDGGSSNPSSLDSGGQDFMGSQDGAKASPETPNGFDDDLDGQVDEDLPCKLGSTQACFPGPVQKIQGICKKGTQICQGIGEFGIWGKCTGAVIPRKEICGNKIDEDCDGKDQDCYTPPPPPPKSACEGFIYGVSARPVDIVFAIDQSGSMGDEIKSVRANMNAFAAYITGAKADYRVILVAARYNDPDNHEVCIPQPLAGPNCTNGPRFRQIDQHVDSHDAWVRIMQHIKSIESFMRPNSIRHIVSVTDDEAKGTTWALFNTFLKARPGYKDYVHHSIVALVDKGCAADDGKQYIALSNLTGGLKFHICNANWTSLFQILGKNVSTATTKFMLKHKAKPGSIVVKYGAVTMTQGKDWDYDPLMNQIVLKGTLPPTNTKILVCYHY